MEPESYGEIEVQRLFGIVVFESAAIFEIIMDTGFCIQTDCVSKMVFCANGCQGREREVLVADAFGVRMAVVIVLPAKGCRFSAD